MFLSLWINHALRRARPGRLLHFGWHAPLILGRCPQFSKDRVGTEDRKKNCQWLEAGLSPLMVGNTQPQNCDAPVLTPAIFTWCAAGHWRATKGLQMCPWSLDHSGWKQWKILLGSVVLFLGHLSVVYSCLFLLHHQLCLGTDSCPRKRATEPTRVS